MRIKTANTILYCTRWTETMDFYTSGLNLKQLVNRGWFVEFYLTDSARLSIADESRCSIKSANGKCLTISLGVDDLEAKHRKFEEKKLNPTRIKPLWGSRVFYIYDPEKNRIEFWS